MEIKLIVEGKGTRYIGDSIADFEPGDFCIVGSGTPHCWSSVPVRGRWVRARLVQFDPALFAGGSLDTVTRFLDRAKLGIELCGAARAEAQTELERLFQAKTPARRLAQLHVLLALAAEATEVRLLGSPRTVNSEQQQSRTLAGRVLEFLTANATEPLTQSEVAAQFGLSAAGFSRFFTREFGKPFVRYLAELRVGHAGHLLVGQELSMVEVAAASGFGTVASLDRHFRSIKGTTPSAYRRRAREMCHR